jgi:hypothetical protein
MLLCTPDSDSEFAGQCGEGVVVGSGGSVAAGVVCGADCAWEVVVEPANVVVDSVYVVLAGEEVEAAGTGVVGSCVEALDVV